MNNHSLLNGFLFEFHITQKIENKLGIEGL